MLETDTRYRVLRSILDGYIAEGATSPKARSLYLNAKRSDVERDQAASRAYIHLFLEAKYGLHEFAAREHLITDASGDGGVDAYYIDHDRRTVVLVQSKFRATAKNFNEKHITIDEIVKVEIDRILRGKTTDEQGNAYNGKILQLQRDVASLPDAYAYQVVVLANVREEEKRAVERLLAPFETVIYDFRRCYEDLVVPILRGEQTYFTDFRLNIDMSNKSAGSRLSAKIQTQHGLAEITVILAPTLEIAKAMSRYRNSILRFNPRSYLEFTHQSTNSQIRNSIEGRSSGEFALLNNGITILSDDTNVTELTGVADTARVLLRNPQIINGGQTAYTLSRVYDDCAPDKRNKMFEDKEVVVRIITLNNIAPDKKRELIEEISSATNSQTQVIAADRVVANGAQREIATLIFLEHGLLYEHKRGEYADALRRGYIAPEQIIERSLFLRLMLLAGGDFHKSVQKGSVRKGSGFKYMDTSAATIARFDRTHAVYRIVLGLNPTTTGRIAELFAVVETAMAALDAGLIANASTIDQTVQAVCRRWPEILDWCLARAQKERDPSSRTPSSPTDKWARSSRARNDLRAYLEQFGLGPPTAETPIVVGAAAPAVEVAELAPATT